MPSFAAPAPARQCAQSSCLAKGKGKLADSEGFDIERLLACLPRGSMPGADNSAAFLGAKARDLLARLQRAQEAEQEAREVVARFQEELRAARTRSGAESFELLAELTALREETRSAEAASSEASREAAVAKEQLSHLKAETEALEMRQKMLDELRAAERARAAREAGLLFRRGSDEVNKLVAKIDGLTARKAVLEKELRSFNERRSWDEERHSKLKAQIQIEEEARDRANETAAAQREELNEARNHLAGLQERLATVQATSLRCDEDLKRRVAHREMLQDEAEKASTWLLEASVELDGLRSSQTSLEKVHIETAELRQKLSSEEADAKHLTLLIAQRQADVEIADRQLLEMQGKTQEVEQAADAIRARLARLEEEQADVQEALEGLRHGQVQNSGVKQNLELETQLLLLEAETLRKDQENLAAERAALRQKLQLVSPALLEAKRRAKDLEEAIVAATRERQFEKEQMERMERETVACQGKMQLLREENVRLTSVLLDYEVRLETHALPMAVASKHEFAWKHEAYGGHASTTRGAASPACRRGFGWSAQRTPRPSSAPRSLLRAFDTPPPRAVEGKPLQTVSPGEKLELDLRSLEDWVRQQDSRLPTARGDLEQILTRRFLEEADVKA